MSGRRPADIAHLMVVPDNPGPLVRLADVDPTRSDVDEILDDVFGEVDDDGPGVADAVLLAGGTAAVLASQVFALPAIVLFGGLAGLGLGSVLPIRSGFRRAQGRRRDAKIQSLIGNDHLLDIRPPLVKELVAAHADALALAECLASAEALRSRNVAHGLVVEVAMLLDGHTIYSDVETHYVADRLEALRKLVQVIGEATTNRTSEQSRTVAARMQLDANVPGTALDDAAQLAEDLRHDRDA